MTNKKVMIDQIHSLEKHSARLATHASDLNWVYTKMLEVQSPEEAHELAQDMDILDLRVYREWVDSPAIFKEALKDILDIYEELAKILHHSSTGRDRQ